MKDKQEIDFKKLAAELIQKTADLQKQVLIKHTEGVLEGIYDKLSENDVERAMEVIANALKEDASYYMGWKANIAMAIYDEILTDFISEEEKTSLHNSCNRGAANFLKLCFNVDHPISDAG